MNKKSLIIAVDFDGTICQDKWPKIGPPNIKLINWLNGQKNSGKKIILWTCRVGRMLDEAVLWCANQGLYFDAVNNNLPETIQDFGGDTRKIFAHTYIDDRNSNPFNLPFIEKHSESEIEETKWKDKFEVVKTNMLLSNYYFGIHSELYMLCAEWLLRYESGERTLELFYLTDWTR